MVNYKKLNHYHCFMVCSDVKKIHKFILANKLDVSEFELIRATCPTCKDQDNCIHKK